MPRDIRWSGSGFSRDHARAFLPFSGPQSWDLRRAAVGPPERASPTSPEGVRIGRQLNLDQGIAPDQQSMWLGTSPLRAPGASQRWAGRVRYANSIAFGLAIAGRGTTSMENRPERHSEPGKPRNRASNIALVGFLALGAFYLIAEHRAHILGWWPWLLILACPLLHFFMHGKHGGHGDHSGGSHDSRDTHRH